MTEEICKALAEKGVLTDVEDRGTHSEIHIGGGVTFIVIEKYARSEEEASVLSAVISNRLEEIRSGAKAMVITRDLWCGTRDVLLARMLSHCGIFTRIFARNCEVRRIEKPVADSFLNRFHSYGAAVCRHCYGLFTTKDIPDRTPNAHSDIPKPIIVQASETGSNQWERPSHSGTQTLPAGTLVAVAEFSNGRKWKKEEGEIASYEWVRYASLPNVRVDGGMGKILSKFIEEVRPDDIMSYADLEWSDGEAYRRLGFIEDGRRPSVLFAIDPASMRRIPLTGSRKSKSLPHSLINDIYYRNFGSIKYRLRPHPTCGNGGECHRR